MEKSNFSTNDVLPIFEPLKNYLYTWEKQKTVSGKDMTKLYDRLTEEQGIQNHFSWKLLMKKNNLKIWTFTFENQTNEWTLLFVSIISFCWDFISSHSFSRLNHFCKFLRFFLLLSDLKMSFEEETNGIICNKTYLGKIINIIASKSQ